MSDLRPDEGSDQARVRDRSTPRWVKVLGVIVLVLAVLLLVSRLMGIQHGPDLHSSWLAAERLAFVVALAAC